MKFFFFNCEQFLLNAFLSKIIIYPKKVRFLPKKACFLHFSCTPHSSTDRRTDVVKFGYKIYKMAYSLTLRMSAHCFFPGKNRIRKIREKSGYEISYICGQILRLDSIIVRYKEKCRSFFVIFTNFVIFNINISMAMSMISLYNPHICTFQLI